MTFRITTPEQELACETIDQTLAELRELHHRFLESGPEFVDIVGSFPGGVSIGLGSTKGVYILYVRPDGETSVHSKNEDASNDIEVFNYFGSDTEHVKGDLIRPDAAFKAVGWILSHGTLPADVLWEDD